jgi:CheY-like chemotaxis protein
MAAVDILIVDDDADIRESLQLALELEGYMVHTARHGGDAWAMLEGGLRPALMLLDLAMPVLSGPELLERLRADERLAALPVVILTAFGTLAAGVADRAQVSLHKPVDLGTLLSTVARLAAPRAAAG